MSFDKEAPDFRRLEPGFTLLEVLISLTIVALIFVAVLGAIRIGVRSWEGGEQRAEENQRTRSLVEGLARELAMMYPVRMKDQDRDIILFRGKSDSLEFATLPQFYRAEPFGHMMRMVSYTVESDRGLMMTESYPLVAQASDSVEGQAQPLDERVSEVRFRYLISEGRPEDNLPPVWRDSWDPSRDEAPASISRGSAVLPGQRALRGSDRLPLAVELTLTIRQTTSRETRELILPPLVFPVQVGRTL